MENSGWKVMELPWLQNKEFDQADYYHFPFDFFKIKG